MKNDEMEREANRFAAALLMPKEKFIDEWEKLLHIEPIFRISILAHKFSVPIGSSRERAKTLKLF